MIWLRGQKDPRDNDDLTWDWTDDMAGATIVPLGSGGFTVVMDQGSAVPTILQVSGVFTTARFVGGQDNELHRARGTVTFSDGRILSRTLVFRVKNK